MTPKEFYERLLAYQNEVKEKTLDILEVAAFEVLAEMQNRIFNKGLAADSSKIGTYSTEPIYVSVPYKGLPKSGLKKVGKVRKDGKAKKTKKTSYMEKGYKEFRGKVGRENSFVNLDLTGSLRLSMIVDKKNQSQVVLRIKKSKDTEKARANETRFGKNIFSMTLAEKKIFLEALEREILLIQKSFFN